MGRDAGSYVLTFTEKALVRAWFLTCALSLVERSESDG